MKIWQWTDLWTAWHIWLLRATEQKQKHSHWRTRFIYEDSPKQMHHLLLFEWCWCLTFSGNYRARVKEALKTFDFCLFIGFVDKNGNISWPWPWSSKKQKLNWNKERFQNTHTQLRRCQVQLRPSRVTITFEQSWPKRGRARNKSMFHFYNFQSSGHMIDITFIVIYVIQIKHNRCHAPSHHPQMLTLI